MQANLHLKKEEKKVHMGNELSNILPKSLHTRKKSQPPDEGKVRAVHLLDPAAPLADAISSTHSVDTHIPEQLTYSYTIITI